MATKAELLEEARARGLAVDESASKDEVQAALDAGDPSKAADQAVDGHHVDSKIVPLDDDEKAHPSSVQNKELTPAERNVKESAFGAPENEE